jgi:hypothetical protein
MKTRQITSRQYFRQTSIIFFAMLGCMISLAGVGLFLRFSETITGDSLMDPSHTLLVAALVLVFSGYAGGVILFQNKIRVISESQDLKEKMKRYRTLLILRYTLIEFPVLVSTGFYIASGNPYFLLVSAAGMLIFMMQIPSASKAEKELNLSYEEKIMINDPNTIIAETELDE